MNHEHGPGGGLVQSRLSFPSALGAKKSAYLHKPMKELQEAKDVKHLVSAWHKMKFSINIFVFFKTEVYLIALI